MIKAAHFWESVSPEHELKLLNLTWKLGMFLSTPERDEEQYILGMI